MKKEKMNDKGFSLVELIIVIAIMAVLVVVLAPQYLKYVERARNSTDTSNATSIVTALQVYAADPDVETGFAKGSTYTISVNSTGGTASTSDAQNATVVTTALSSAGIDLSSVKCKSKTKWDYYEIIAKVQDDGSLKFSYESGITNGATNTDFEKAMTGSASASTSSNP